MELEAIKSILPKLFGNESYYKFCENQGRKNIRGVQWSGAVVGVLTESSLILIKRSELVPRHKNQWAFIGGKREKEEKNPLKTMAREFEEETMLNFSCLDFMGYLPSVFTAVGQLVVPGLFFLKEKARENFFQKITSNGEWNHIVLYPLSHLMQLEKWLYGERISSESLSPLYFFPLKRESILWKSSVEENISLEEIEILWGATGRIVWDLVNILLKRL